MTNQGDQKLKNMFRDILDNQRKMQKNILLVTALVKKPMIKLVQFRQSLQMCFENK